MPRKFIKKYMPSEEKIKQHKSLRWLGSYLHNPYLWRLNRTSVARAFLVGLFCAFLPLPTQMIIAAILAISIKSNLPISVGLVWLTNPLTMPPIFYFTYLVGNYLIGDPDKVIEFEMTMEWFEKSLPTIWWPLLFGSIICGIIVSILGYFCIQWIWTRSVLKKWKNRHNKRPKKSK